MEIIIIIVVIFIFGLVLRRKDDDLLDTLGRGANFGCWLVLIIAAIIIYSIYQSQKH